jgi:hypothetical protein
MLHFGEFTQAELHDKHAVATWNLGSSSKSYLGIQSVPQREHHTSLQISTD